MPHDPHAIISAAAIDEVKRLRDSNRELRALVDHLCGEIKKIAAELSKLIDKDIH
jgi:hypothetical protein